MLLLSGYSGPRAEVVSVATPLPFKATTPSEVPPSKNSTLPVGVPVGGLVITVAVKMMFSLSQAGLLLEVTVVDVGPCAFTFETKNENKKKTVKQVILIVRDIAKSNMRLWRL